MLHMKPLVLLAALVAPAAAAILPREFNQTSSEGFPKPNTQQLMAIAEQAGGKLPAGSLPTDLSNTSITALQLIAFNELFEVAYFSSLLNNLTMNATGYDVPEKKAVIEIVKTVRAVSKSCEPFISIFPILIYSITARAVSRARGSECPERNWRLHAFKLQVRRAS